MIRSWPSLRASACVGLALAALSTSASALAQSWDYSMQRLEVPRRRAGLAFGRLDPDARLDLVVADDARLSLRLQTPKGDFAEPLELSLEDELGGGALLQVAKLGPDESDEIIALHRTGVYRFGYDASARRLVRRAPILSAQRGIPFLHLAFADFLYDMDGDGDLDLGFPVNGAVYVFVREGDTFVRRGEVKVDPLGVTLASGRAELDSETSARLEIPKVRIERRAAAGTGGSQEPVWTYDRRPDPLAPFRKRQGLEGEAAAKLDVTYEDLDGDGISDYLLVEGDRIWVYRGREAGFDFEQPPDQLLKVSVPPSAVIGTVLLPLDEDARDDLLLYKLTAPSLGRIVAALAIGLRIEIELLGYRYDGAPVFARQPAYRSTLVLRLPPLLRLIGQVEELSKRIEALGKGIAGFAVDDFDGDGERDVARPVDERLEIYVGQAAASERSESRGAGPIREFLFGEKRREITLDDALKLFEELLAGLHRALALETPTATLSVPQKLAKRLDRVDARDLNGDRRADLLVYFKPDDPGSTVPSLRDAPETLIVYLSPARAEETKLGRDGRFR
jgi:hypothetical protein